MIPRHIVLTQGIPELGGWRGRGGKGEGEGGGERERVGERKWRAFLNGEGERERREGGQNENVGRMERVRETERGHALVCYRRHCHYWWQ